MPKKRVGLRTEKSEEGRQGKDNILELLRLVANDLEESKNTLHAAHKLLTKAAKKLEESKRKGY